MKTGTMISTSLLGLVLGITPFAVAQNGHGGGHDADSHHPAENKDHKEHSSARQGSNQHLADDARRHEQPAHEQHAEQRHEPQPHYRPAHQEDRHEVQERERHVAERDVWRDHRAQHWDREHHTWRQRGGYHGYRIPQDRFATYFGPRHWFRVHSEPVMVVGGYPRFRYSGFWLSVVDPCPEYWPATWYQTDDVYVDYVNDGYYMYNRSHPGVAVAVSVSF